MFGHLPLIIIPINKLRNEGRRLASDNSCRPSSPISFITFSIKIYIEKAILVKVAIFEVVD